MIWIGKMTAVLAVLIVIVAAAGCGGQRQDDARVKFTMSRFLDDFAKAWKNNPVLKRAEKRTINGREMDYFEIGLRDEDGDSLRLECLGLQMGQEHWMITFGYWTDDKTMEAIAEKAMASIRIE